MANILVPAGTQDVPVGQLVAILAEEKEDIGAFEKYSSADVSTDSKPEKGTTRNKVPETSSEKKLFGPAVRRMMEEYGISDWSQLHSSGPHGRILKEDVIEYLKHKGKEEGKTQQEPSRKKESSPQPSLTKEDSPGRVSYEDIPLSNMRKVIARRLTESKTQIPHEYCQIQCQLDKLLELRNIYKTQRNISISVNDFVIRATAIALGRVPELNVIWDETSQSGKRMDRIDISFAVSIENGLITPIITVSHKRQE